MTTNLRGHCPACRAIDWSRNAEKIAVDVNGNLHNLVLGPVERSTEDAATWTCGRCGFQPSEGSELAAELALLRDSDQRVLPRSTDRH